MRNCGDKKRRSRVAPPLGVKVVFDGPLGSAFGSAFILVPASVVSAGRTCAAMRGVRVRSWACCGMGPSLTSTGTWCGMGPSLTSIGSGCRSCGSTSTRDRAAVIPPAIADVSSSAAMDEAMVAPAMAIAPLVPWAYAHEDAIVKIARSVESHGSAGVGRIVVVAVGTDRRRTADVDNNLRLSWWSEGKWYKECQCGDAEKRFESAHALCPLRDLRVVRCVESQVRGNTYEWHYTL